MDIRYTFKQIAATAAFALACNSAYAQSSEQFVVIHCESPGTLQLSEESLTAPYLKITGDIDARDFEKLKRVTINVTRTLDLSDSRICAYSGDGGCATGGLGPDWIVGDGSDEVATYPANAFPTHAFAEVRNNSLSKFYRGSYSLSKVILPATLTSFMNQALAYNEMLVELEVPENSTSLYECDNVIYSFDRKKLLAIPPAFYGDVTVIESVTDVTTNVFDYVSPASVTFKSPTSPKFQSGNNISAAYIIAPNPDDYKEIYPDIDCISSIETINVDNSEPGQLLGALGNMGYSRSDVRAVKVSGHLNFEDFRQLMDLPNLHIADLSEAIVKLDGSPQYDFYNKSITDLDFPRFDGYLALTIADGTRLNGDLNVPEGTYWFASSSRRFSSATFPSTIQSIDDWLFREHSVIKSIDFSKCNMLTEVDCLVFAGRLTDVKLPPNLVKLEGFGGPVTSINLPPSLKYINSPGDWLIEELVIPQSVTELTINSLPFVKRIDATNATSLQSVRGFANTPMLHDIDLSMCPIISIDYFLEADKPASAASASKATSASKAGRHNRIVATGGTHYPAPKIAGIERIVFPSTLQSLSGINNCLNLKDIDLMRCFRLKKITGLNGCTSLESLSLPETALHIDGLADSPSLSSVKTASSTPPSLKQDSESPLDFSKIRLTVANGSAGAFRMAEGWENCKEITEGGYRVSINYDACSSTIDNPERAIINGAGLYAPGSEATLFAAPSGNYSCMKWIVNGNPIASNPTTITVNENVASSPGYTIDENTCDVLLTFYLPVAQTVNLPISSYERSVLVNGERVHNKTNTSWDETTLSLPMQAGTNTVAINGRWLCLHFEAADGISDETDNYSVTEFKINNKESIRQIYASYFDMDCLDISGNTAIHYLVTRYNNSIKTLDISRCPQLTDIVAYDAEIEKFFFDETPLESIDISRNKLKSLDFRGYDNLRIIYATNNLISEFAMTSEACTDLLLQYNPMAFSTLTPLMYDIYMEMLERLTSTDKLDIWFSPDVTGLNETGVLDLSREMFPPGCSTRTTVSINGNIIADNADGLFHLNEGYSTIVLTNEAYPNLQYSASVYSNHITLVEEITLNKNELTVETGETFYLSATVFPSDADDCGVIWTSSDYNVASVNTIGTCYAAGPGQAIITATARDGSGVSASCVVTVEDPYIPVSDFSLDPYSMHLEVGETATIYVYYEPSNATNPTFRWTNENPDLAELNQVSETKAKVTALKEGKAMISVNGAEGAINSHCVLYITDNSGVDSIYGDSDYVHVENNTIIIDAPFEIGIYTTSGHMIFKGSNGTIESPESGVYLATGADYSKKIIIK